MGGPPPYAAAGGGGGGAGGGGGGGVGEEVGRPGGRSTQVDMADPMGADDRVPVHAMALGAYIAMMWVLLFLAHSVALGLFFPAFFVPCYWLYRFWDANRDAITGRDVIFQFWQGFGPAVVYLFFVEMCLFMLSLLAGVLYILESLSPSLALLWIFAMCVALPEECLKISKAHRERELSPPESDTKGHVIASTSFSLGYSTAQVVLMTFIWTNEAVEREDDVGLNVLEVLFVATLWGLLGTPMHVLTGYLAGVKASVRAFNGAAQEEEPIWREAMLPAVIRGTFYWQFFMWFSLGIGNVALLLSILTGAGLCAALVKIIKAEEEQLPIEYRQRVGYLSAMGYGILPEGPDGVEMRAGERPTPQATNSTFTLGGDDDDDVERGRQGAPPPGGHY